MRKIIGGVLFLPLLLGSAGCQNNPPPASGESRQTAENDPAFANLGLDATPRGTTVAHYEMPMAAFRDGARGLKQKIADLRDVVVVFVERNDSAGERMLALVKRQAQTRGVPTLTVFPSADEQIAYGIGNFPTTILFLRGAEKQRWLREYREETFSHEFAKQFQSSE